MTKLELFSVLSLAFLVFTILFIRVGFFFGITISSYSLLFSFLLYFALASFLLTTMDIPNIHIKDRFLSLLGFISVSVLLFMLSFPISQSYDLSWDGQGYHQTAIIALAEDWNPIQNSSISLKQKLPSQIFAEGYPSALWEIQSTIYAVVGKINAAKIMNFAITIISFSFLYTLLRKLSIGKVLATIISLLVVFQPVSVIQLLTYMQDGFGYQLLVIGISSLLLFLLNSKANWTIIPFLFAELLLVSTKYSLLPVALLLGLIFLLVLLNRYLNKDFFIRKNRSILILIFSIICIILMYLPYIRNETMHGHLFYPTNIPELMGSVTYNNIPHNLKENNKFVLLFYGMFSKSQNYFGGDPTSKENIASLKIPFTFTMDEVYDSAALFNNRVGAGGPLYSGLIVFSFTLLLFMSFKSQNQKERYAIYSIYTIVGLILFLSLLAPTPNLFRYTNQLQLIPFIILIPIYAIFQRNYVKVLTIMLLFLITINTVLFFTAVIKNNFIEIKRINNQFDGMRLSGNTYRVQAQQFYSNYVLLNENNVQFYIVNKLNCNKVKDLVSSSNTTHYCLE